MTITSKIAALVCVALLAWAALVAFQVGAMFGFGATGLFGLLVIASLVSFFVAAVVAMLSRRWLVTCYLGGVVFVIVSSIPAAAFISDRQREASIAAAQPIIAAAERFRVETGAYPKSCSDLIPAYLPTEPPTKMGFRGTPFSLSGWNSRLHITFALPGWLVCTTTPNRSDGESMTNVYPSAATSGVIGCPVSCRTA